MTDTPDLKGLLHRWLQQAPQGLSEYELIQRLKDPQVAVFPAALNLSDPLVLFKSHFLLFNQLYSLRDQLRLAALGELQISASCIRLLPPVSGREGMGEQDSLRDYYLNWQHFEQASRQGVSDLLDDFWRRMAGIISEDERREALAALELSEQASASDIRRQYKRLMHRHHPDKGGDGERTRELTEAYRKLT